MKKLKRAVGFLIFSVLVLFLVLGIEVKELYNEEEQKTMALVTVAGQGSVAGVSIMPEIKPQEETVLPSLRLVMIGDMLMHPSVMNSGRQEDGTYNYSHLFGKIGGTLWTADIAIVNQETILGGTEMGLSGYPTFNSPQELGDAEAAAGFDVILHGTNHALDKGRDGILNSIRFWEENHPDIAYLGIHKNQESQDNIYVYENKGMRIAILNYTYGTNGIQLPKDMPYAVDYLEEERILRDLQKARELADFIIVCPHWGTEYNLGIDSSQRRWTDIFLKNGVDLVIGTHPHVIEPMEWVSDEEGHRMLVYYSLGNFVTGSPVAGTRVTSRMVGGMADVTIGMTENGEVTIKDYTVHPLVCHRTVDGGFCTYFLKDYTEELANENLIRSQDGEFSLSSCRELVTEVWGEEYLIGS